MPLRLAPSVLLTGSLQWISLLCVCLLSHCGGRQTCQSPEAASACLAVRGLYMRGRLLSRWRISPSLRKHRASPLRRAVEFIECGPLARATMATVFHMLPRKAGIHQPDQARHLTHFCRLSGSGQFCPPERPSTVDAAVGKIR